MGHYQLDRSCSFLTLIFFTSNHFFLFFFFTSNHFFILLFFIQSFFFFFLFFYLIEMTIIYTLTRFMVSHLIVSNFLNLKNGTNQWKIQEKYYFPMKFQLISIWKK